MLRSMLLAAGMHALVLGWVWVGFPTMLPKSQITFYFSQLSTPARPDDLSFGRALPPLRDQGQQMSFWGKVRAVDKPRR